MRALRAGLERGARFARRTGTGARFARRTGTGCALRAQNWNRCALRTQNWNRCALRTQNWNVIDSAFRVWSYGRDFARDCRPASSSVQCCWPVSVEREASAPCFQSERSERFLFGGSRTSLGENENSCKGGPLMGRPQADTNARTGTSVRRRDCRRRRLARGGGPPTADEV